MPDGYFRWACIFAVVSALPLLFVFFGTRERPEYAALGTAHTSGIIEGRRQESPLRFRGCHLPAHLGFDRYPAGHPVVFHQVRRRAGSQQRHDHGDHLCYRHLFLPFWEWASRHWNKRLAYAAGIAFWAVVQIVLITLSPSTPLALIFGLCALAGIGVSAAHVLPWSIIPDAIEWDEWQTGERHEGMFYSLIMLANKVAFVDRHSPGTACAAKRPVIHPMLPSSPPALCSGIRLSIGPIPALLLVTGIVFAALYPLSRDKHRHIVEELEARRQAAERETK